jgi:hypothetical protein
MFLTPLIAMALVAQPASVADLGWLAGCWTSSEGSRTVTELWLPPQGGTMMGVSRTVSAGKTVDYEFLVLRNRANILELVAKPSGQPEAVFSSTSLSAREAVFENPSHDFPTRIAYKQTADGVLATISGVTSGKPRTITFDYKAADCRK